MVSLRSFNSSSNRTLSNFLGLPFNFLDSKFPFCQPISQKLSFDVSFWSSTRLKASSLGDSIKIGPMMPLPLRTLAGPPCEGEGPDDCHLSAIVDTAGGRTGLLSRILSSSSITPNERRGRSYSKLIRVYGSIYF